MKTITVKLYQYAELSDKAKTKAQDWYSSHADVSYLWDDMQEDAKMIELEIWIGRNGQVEGKFLGSAESTARKILTDHGAKCETYKDAKAYLKNIKKLKDDDAREAADEEFLHALCEDYRIMYEQGEQYAFSEEAIVEAMDANEWTFLENGTRFNG